MQVYLDALQKAIAPVRQKIVAHPLYKHINTLEDLQVFTRYHVYAVWDFMSLLKGLQQQLTCVQIPWVPVGHPNTRYLINEIVTGEESDVDENGQRCSHYELYLAAMQQMQADTSEIGQLLSAIQEGLSVKAALEKTGVPASIQQFVNFTFDTLEKQDAAVTAAVFTFGREDLIPDMFIELVRDLSARFPGQVERFKYYLERHIEVDGDHHSQLAMEMVQELCGTNADTWQRATRGAVAALEQRLALWDAAYAAMNKTTEIAQ